MSPRSGHFSRSTFRTYARHIDVKWHRCMYVASVTDTVVSPQWWWYVCSGPTHASLHTPQLLSAGAESVGGRCRCRRSCSYVSSFCGHPCCCPQAQNQYVVVVVVVGRVRTCPRFVVIPVAVRRRRISMHCVVVFVSSSCGHPCCCPRAQNQ